VAAATALAAAAGQVDPRQVQSGGGRERRGGGHCREGGGDLPDDPSCVPGHPRPDQQHGDGQDADGQRGRVEVGQLGGQATHVVHGGALRCAAEDDVELGEGDRGADAGEHAVHDRRAHGEGRSGHPQGSQEELAQSGEDGDGAGGAPSVLLDQLGGHDGQSCGGAADLERCSAEPADDDASDRRGDETRLERCAGGERDAEGQRKCDQKDGDGRGDIGAVDAEAAVAAGRTVRALEA
jgi:hypothetical protein